ncbi:decaprenyl-phosphate phosphoribosyltransferase [Aquihabitans sp. McL0605]|uniref:decaprenyl-phosphate phosphoribosyltransferase n=1 Tax=Aquihabitans sp. McL0605 TaxID=3415671 RepID=UPI003CFBBC89
MTLLTKDPPIGTTATRVGDPVAPRLAHPLLTACRPHQWVKNLLVYAVPFAAGRLMDPRTFVQASLAAVVFVLASSATYLLNDAGDAAADRLHPVKCRRPIASGQLPVPRARRAAALLLAAAIAAAVAMGPGMAAIIAAYLISTTAYTRWLKHVPLVDAVVVAAGFLLRTAAGGAATGLALSPLFLVVASAGSLFIVFGKRLGEVILLGPAAGSHRRVLGWYTPQRCRALLAGSLLTTVAAFTAWALGASEPGAPSALATGSVSVASVAIIPFLGAAARSWELIRAGRGGDPLRLLTTDRLLPLLGLATVVLVGVAIYG